MPEIDKIIHQPVRLRLMAALVALRSEDQMDFTWLKQLLGLTDGNLGAHIIKLEEAGYLKVEKTFVGRRPKTYLSATDKGRGAFAGHSAALQEIINAARPDKKQ
jgi:DNA-binding MarR family transcriptional regulator